MYRRKLKYSSIRQLALAIEFSNTKFSNCAFKKDIFASVIKGKYLFIKDVEDGYQMDEMSLGKSQFHDLTLITLV